MKFTDILGITTVLIIIVMGISFIIAAIVMPVAYHTRTETVMFQVEDKERIQDGNSSRYLIFTPNEVFQNKDSWLRLKFGSSDIYGKIKVGQTCVADVVGFRLPFLSTYRNIINADCA